MELLLPENHPQINWSRNYQHEDGNPADTFGLIGLRIGPDGWRMTHNHTMMSYRAADMRDSLLIFGEPQSPRIWVYSTQERLFSLDDAERINQTGSTSQSLIASLRQMRTAELVIGNAKRLLESVRLVAVQENPEIITEAGIIEAFVTSQEQKLKPDKIQAATHELIELGVREIQTVSSLLNRRPEGRESYELTWLIANLSAITSLRERS